jgi:hypothetical protein
VCLLCMRIACEMCVCVCVWGGGGLVAQLCFSDTKLQFLHVQSAHDAGRTTPPPPSLPIPICNDIHSACTHSPSSDHRLICSRCSVHTRTLTCALALFLLSSQAHPHPLAARLHLLTHTLASSQAHPPPTRSAPAPSDAHSRILTSQQIQRQTRTCTLSWTLAVRVVHQLLVSDWKWYPQLSLHL